MIDSATGLPYDWSNLGGGAAASMQPALIPNTQPTPVGQGAGQGGGMSPLLMQLLGNGVTPGSGMGAQFMPQLIQYLLGQQQQQPPSLPSGYGGNTVPDPLTQQQRAFMGYGGPGQPVDWYTAMGMPGGMNNGAQGPGWTGGQAAAGPMYQPQTPQQTSTPQDFVNQWQKMFGST